MKERFISFSRNKRLRAIRNLCTILNVIFFVVGIIIYEMMPIISWLIFGTMIVMEIAVWQMLYAFKRQDEEVIRKNRSLNILLSDKVTESFYIFLLIVAIVMPLIFESYLAIKLIFIIISGIVSEKVADSINKSIRSKLLK